MFDKRRFVSLNVNLSFYSLVQVLNIRGNFDLAKGHCLFDDQQLWDLDCCSKFLENAYLSRRFLIPRK